MTRAGYGALTISGLAVLFFLLTWTSLSVVWQLLPPLDIDPATRLALVVIVPIFAPIFGALGGLLLWLRGRLRGCASARAHQR
ncbi:MAG: hypothetical protein ACREN5_08105 [Gemmatimonadales bacterium]